MKKLQTQLKNIAAASTFAFVMAFGVVLGTAATPAYADCDTSTLTISGGASCSKGNDTPDELIGDGGVFQTITNVMLFLIGAISVIMLIIGGIRYTTSNGNTSQVEQAKNTIMYAIIGLIVAILAYAVVKFVTSTFTTT